MESGRGWTGTPTGGARLLAVAIGASAGGPQAVETVLTQLHWSFPAPIAICQHMTEGMTGPWAARLSSLCHITVSEARNGEPFLPKHAYIAPSGLHMRIRGSAADPFISLDADREPHSLHVPSINILLASVAETFGSRSLGAVLTGMGNDGADGLLAIRRAGGITLAQPSESAFMPSMPLAAIDAGAVAEVVPLESMSSVIAERVAGGF